LWLKEIIIGRDLDNGVVGKPEPFRVEWTDPQNRRIENHDWPIPEEQVREIGKAHIKQESRPQPPTWRETTATGWLVARDPTRITAGFAGVLVVQ